MGIDSAYELAKLDLDSAFLDPSIKRNEKQKNSSLLSFSADISQG